MNKNIVSVVVTTILLTIFTGGCGSSHSAYNTTNTSANVSNVTSATSLATVDALDITIREASDYLNGNIPRGNRIVILNIQSNLPDLSDYIIDELIANAVNDRLFSVVDRQQLETIRAEQNFQLSGEVDDNEAMAIGRFLGAQTIVSGAVNRIGAGHRIRIRALDVQTAQVQGQFNRNISSSPIISSLIESSVSTNIRTTQGVPPTPVTKPGIIWEGNGHSYEVVNIPMSWISARHYAEARGGYLATITSYGEQAFIENLLSRTTSPRHDGTPRSTGINDVYWIGGYCESDRIWKWITNEHMNYTNWGIGEPNNSQGRQNRMAMYRSPQSHLGKWDDYYGDSVVGFIIEWD